MPWTAGQRAVALGLGFRVWAPEVPLHKHALALARKVAREYDGHIVDVPGLTAAALARLANAMCVRMAPGMGVRVEVCW